jgi:hypothetical protein
MTTIYRMFISDDGAELDESGMAVFGCIVHVLEDGTRYAQCDVTIEEVLNAFITKQAILWVIQDAEALPN